MPVFLLGPSLGIRTLLLFQQELVLQVLLLALQTVHLPLPFLHLLFLQRHVLLLTLHLLLHLQVVLLLLQCLALGPVVLVYALLARLLATLVGEQLGVGSLEFGYLAVLLLDLLTQGWVRVARLGLPVLLLQLGGERLYVPFI